MNGLCYGSDPNNLDEYPKYPGNPPLWGEHYTVEKVSKHGTPSSSAGHDDASGKGGGGGKGGDGGKSGGGGEEGVGDGGIDANGQEEECYGCGEGVWRMRRLPKGAPIEEKGGVDQGGYASSSGKVSELGFPTSRLPASANLCFEPLVPSL